MRDEVKHIRTIPRTGLCGVKRRYDLNRPPSVPYPSSLIPHSLPPLIAL